MSKTHTLREDAFDDLTEEAAYWLGFLTADGCVRKDRRGYGVVTVGLASRDTDHLYKLRSFLGSSHPVKTFKYPCMISEASQFQVYSGSLVEKLWSLGVTHDSLRRHVPDGLQDSSDYWRGVVDGDGSLGIYRGYPMLELVGGLGVVNQFAAFVRRYSDTKASVRQHKSIWTFNLAGTCALPIVRLLYHEAAVSLDRKQLIADRMLVMGYRRSVRKYTGSCSAPGCSRQDHARGLCSMHYQIIARRVRLYGESWPVEYQP